MAVVKVTCPTKGAVDEHGVGCGATFEDEPDHEGLMDCPECGMWFPVNDPHANASPEASHKAKGHKCIDVEILDHKGAVHYVRKSCQAEVIREALQSGYAVKPVQRQEVAPTATGPPEPTLPATDGDGFSLPEGWHRDGWTIRDAQDVPIIRIAKGGRGDPPEWRESAATLASAAPEVLEALERVPRLIATARKYFPKSVKNADTFDLELTNASACKAIGKARKLWVVD